MKENFIDKQPNKHYGPYYKVVDQIIALEERHFEMCAVKYEFESMVLKLATSSRFRFVLVVFNILCQFCRIQKNIGMTHDSTI